MRGADHRRPSRGLQPIQLRSCWSRRSAASCRTVLTQARASARCDPRPVVLGDRYWCLRSATRSWARRKTDSAINQFAEQILFTVDLCIWYRTRNMGVAPDIQNADALQFGAGPSRFVGTLPRDCASRPVMETGQPFKCPSLLRLERRAPRRSPRCPGRGHAHTVDCPVSACAGGRGAW